MNKQLPDWYRGWADRVLQLRVMNGENVFLERTGLTGYLSALFLADLISTDERSRMEAVANNAMSLALQFPNQNQLTHNKEA